MHIISSSSACSGSSVRVGGVDFEGARNWDVMVRVSLGTDCGLVSSIIGERYAYWGGLRAGVGSPVLPGKESFRFIKWYESRVWAGEGSRMGAAVNPDWTVDSMPGNQDGWRFRNWAPSSEVAVLAGEGIVFVGV